MLSLSELCLEMDTADRIFKVDFGFCIQINGTLAKLNKIWRQYFDTLYREARLRFQDSKFLGDRSPVNMRSKIKQYRKPFHFLNFSKLRLVSFCIVATINSRLRFLK